MLDSQQPILLQQLEAINLLSYGPQSSPIALGPLNVIVGPNGSGKSNLIEVIDFIRNTPGDIQKVIRRGGGASEWVWKGARGQGGTLNSSWFPYPLRQEALHHDIKLIQLDFSFWIDSEYLAYRDSEKSDQVLYQHLDGVRKIVSVEGDEIEIDLDATPLRESILAQLKDAINYPSLFSLAEIYKSIRIYREWSFGRNTIFREPQKADERNDRLEEDFSNLGLFLNRLRRDPKAKRAILSHLSDLYEGITDFDVSIQGGTVQVFLTEGDYTIPATRLSDGTLRYLCLLAILLDPNPPRLICIEEPELGLHPDIVTKIADLLIDASTRTQLIVTTHSEILIDAMTEHPEAVLVCEKHDGQTVMNRLNKDDLQEWLKKYRLGQIWLRGEIGGTRW